MPSLGVWVVGGLVLASVSLSRIETDKLIELAKGAERVGLIESPKPPAVLPPVVSNPSLKLDQLKQTLSQLDAFVSEVEQIWAQETHLSSPTVLVQYSEDKRSRSLIDLKEGKLIIEHLVDPSAESAMLRLLANALLTPDDPRRVDLHKVQIFSSTETPFLLGQLVDALGKPIDTRAKANKFAAWAVVNKKQRVETLAGDIYRIELPLDANHKQVRAARFARYIEAASLEFGVDVNLLYAIAETESHFNPFAVSRTGALGVMQIMPDRAGRDAMKLLTGVDRQPSYQELTDPKTNIRLGAAYLALLQQHYLKEIAHPRSREYAVIAAYNGGASRAISVFSDSKVRAVDVINALPPQMVYDSIKRRHASAETRGYIEKVTTAKSRYSNRV
jgi:soluble lytic murein transglycosylase-like protein